MLQRLFPTCQEPEGKMIDVPNAEALDVLLGIRGAYLREGLQDGLAGHYWWLCDLIMNALLLSPLITSHSASITIGPVGLDNWMIGHN